MQVQCNANASNPVAGAPNRAAGQGALSAHFPDRMIYMEGSENIFSIIHFESLDDVFPII